MLLQAKLLIVPAIRAILLPVRPDTVARNGQGVAALGAVSGARAIRALHSRIDLVPSRLPQAQRAVMRMAALRASCRVRLF
jgi:hypothetical protein